MPHGWLSRTLGDILCKISHKARNRTRVPGLPPPTSSTLALIWGPQPLAVLSTEALFQPLLSWGTGLDKAAQLCGNGELGILSQNLGLEPIPGP